jgi:NitT/TauT family transport system substrate-binding protein
MQRTFYILSLLTLVLLLAACGLPASPTPATLEPEETATESAPQVPSELTHIDLGVGFVPNVQFAPLYVAQAKGFFAEEGLEVNLEHGYEHDFGLPLLAAIK